MQYDPGINLVAEIAHEQYGSALFIGDSCTCESTSTSSTDNIEIIQATLNGVSINSYYKLLTRRLTSEVVQQIHPCK